MRRESENDGVLGWQILQQAKADYEVDATRRQAITHI
jgi:hypothetical protein